MTTTFPARVLRVVLGTILAVIVITVSITSSLPANKPAGSNENSRGKPARRLVFFLTTGLEDVEEMRISLRNAKEAKESGFLGDVIWVASDRGAEALTAATSDLPEDLPELARAAKAAGVRLVVSRDALQRLGLNRKRLDFPVDEMVPSGIWKVSELISLGYEVIHY